MIAPIIVGFLPCCSNLMWAPHHHTFLLIITLIIVGFSKGQLKTLPFKEPFSRVSSFVHHRCFRNDLQEIGARLLRVLFPLKKVNKIIERYVLRRSS